MFKKELRQEKITPYHPTGNAQVEWFNGTIWKMIQLSVRLWNLTEKYWELVLPVLHSARSLLCTSTNTTPHKHFFSFSCCSSHGISLPSWLMSPGPMLLKRLVRNNKTNPYVDQVKLLNSNLTYASIKYPSGRESTVSVRDLAPCPETEIPSEFSTMEPNNSTPVVPIQEEDITSNEDVAGVQQLKRSEWTRKSPDHYGW